MTTILAQVILLQDRSAVCLVQHSSLMFGPPSPPFKKGPREHAIDLGGDATANYAPFVPCPQRQVARLVGLASVTCDDVVCDLGCGDAGALCEITRLTGCSGLGCDVDSRLLELGRSRIAAQKLNIDLSHQLIEVYMQSERFKRATVLFVALETGMLAQLAPELDSFLDAAPGNRILSQRFQVPGLECNMQIPDCPHDADDCTAESQYFPSLGPAFLYVR
mmetsp:Transcript_93458/g.180174  ORF Transcript_93458/g.180174 Transcript_93458/m.180174 type:complete len:220 (+) Transcript_93458:9-668(+)